MIGISRETVAALVAAGYGVLPSLVWHEQHTAAWALANDDRAEDVDSVIAAIGVISLWWSGPPRVITSRRAFL